MTRTIATTPHSSRRSHAWFAESAPENIWPTNPLENVLFMAWNSMTINTLPLALLNNHVYTIDHSMGNNRARRDEPRPSDHRPDSWCGHSSEVGRPYQPASPHALPPDVDGKISCRLHAIAGIGRR